MSKIKEELDWREWRSLLPGTIIQPTDDNINQRLMGRKSGNTYFIDISKSKDAIRVRHDGYKGVWLYSPLLWKLPYSIVGPLRELLDRYFIEHKDAENVSFYQMGRAIDAELTEIKQELSRRPPNEQ